MDLVRNLHQHTRTARNKLHCTSTPQIHRIAPENYDVSTYISVRSVNSPLALPVAMALFKTKCCEAEHVLTTLRSEDLRFHWPVSEMLASRHMDRHTGGGWVDGRAANVATEFTEPGTRSMRDMSAPDTLAEWLRRRPAKPMWSPRVGSNPTGVALSSPRAATACVSPYLCSFHRLMTLRRLPIAKWGHRCASARQC